MQYRIFTLTSNKIASGEIKLTNYQTAILDDSLDTRYLEALNGFKKIKVGKYLYTTDIISVFFNNYKVDNKTVESNVDLRKRFYKDGIRLNVEAKIYDSNNKAKIIKIDEEYVRYKRSSGSSREGKCLFIKKSLFKKMNKWSLLGIDTNKSNVKKNLVSLEAYKALTLSGIINTVRLNPDNILVLDDYECKFYDECILINKENDELVAKKANALISNNIWDGEGLLDSSIFEELNLSNSMMLLRNRFFKSCVFNTNLKKFFSDNNITDISQIKGDTKAKSIDDIKLIVTESSIKYLKFGSLDDFREKLKEEDSLSTFGIVKVDKKTKYYEGNMVRTSYQLINTLNFTDKDINVILDDTERYRELIQKNPAVLKHHLKNISRHSSNTREIELLDRDDLTLILLNINSKFINTEIYKKFTEDINTSIRENMRGGRILIDGTYATIFGNGYELLLATIGKFDYDNPKSVLKPGEIMCSLFKDKENLVCSRNPHVTMGNLYVVNNVIKEEYNKYFNLSNEIVCVSAINDNIQHRLNGCDYDSDTMLITNNSYFYEKAKNNYNRFLVPVCGLDSASSDIDNLAEIDYNIQRNLVGNIINLSQRYNSLIWDIYNKEPNNKQIDELYNDVCKLAILSGMEIDKAKRDYNVNANEVYISLNNKISEIKKEKPEFFKDLSNNNSKSKYVYHNTSMDNIRLYLSDHKLEVYNTSKPRLNIIDFINIPTHNDSGSYINNANEIKKVIQDLDTKISGIMAEMKKTDEEDKTIYYENINDEKEKAFNVIKNKIDNSSTLYYLFKDEKMNGFIFYSILSFLYYKKRELFYELLRTNDEKDELVRDDDGNIVIYDKKYKIIKVK